MYLTGVHGVPHRGTACTTRGYDTYLTVVHRVPRHDILRYPQFIIFLSLFLGKIEYICPHKYKKTLCCHEEIRKHSYR